MQNYTVDGLKIGRTAAEAVQSLKQMLLVGIPDTGRYMATTAVRVRLYCGAVIDHATPDTFMAGLVQAGLVELTETNDERDES